MMSNEILYVEKSQPVMGRPRKELDERDWQYAEKLAALMCTAAEIGGVFGMSEDTLLKRIREKYDLTFTAWSEQFTAEAKIALRRAQFQSALDGNASMLQFLGRIYLGQNPTTNVSIQTYDPNKDIRNAWKYMEENRYSDVIEAERT
jgi:hypothetical protein